MRSAKELETRWRGEESQKRAVGFKGGWSFRIERNWSAVTCFRGFKKDKLFGTVIRTPHRSW